MQLQIGAHVIGHDGPIGRLKYVVIDPHDMEVTDLIVERGRFFHRDIVVPIGWIERDLGDTIAINASKADLASLPDYHEVEFTQPDPICHPVCGHRVGETRTWVTLYGGIRGGKPYLQRRVRLGVADHEVLLYRGLPVYASDGQRAGVIDHVVVDPTTNAVTHLVIHQQQWWSPQAWIVPQDQVGQMNDDQVQLKLASPEIEKLPRYQAAVSDEQIATRLQRALETNRITREAGVRGDVHRGAVRLTGAITEELAQLARQIAGRIRGVIGVVGDDTKPATTSPAPADRAARETSAAHATPDTSGAWERQTE